MGQLIYQVDRRKSFSKRKLQETCQREKITTVSNQSCLDKDASTGKSKFIYALALEAKPENKASLGAGNFFDKLKKIPFRIRKTNACGVMCFN